MLEYFLSPAKADLLPTDGGGSSARSDPPGYGPLERSLRPPIRNLQPIGFSQPLPLEKLSHIRLSANQSVSLLRTRQHNSTQQKERI